MGGGAGHAAAGAGVGQQEVVHAADAALGVEQAHRDAAAEHRHQYLVFGGGVELTGQHLDRRQLEVRVEIAGGGDGAGGFSFHTATPATGR
ncbi:hypothetical protein D3C78_1688080 [compost metagenome]